MCMRNSLDHIAYPSSRTCGTSGLWSQSSQPQYISPLLPVTCPMVIDLIKASGHPHPFALSKSLLLSPIAEQPTDGSRACIGGRRARPQRGTAAPAAAAESSTRAQATPSMTELLHQLLPSRSCSLFLSLITPTSGISEKIELGLDVSFPVFCEGRQTFSEEREDAILCSKRSMTSAKWRNEIPPKFL